MRDDTGDGAATSSCVLPVGVDAPALARRQLTAWLRDRGASPEAIADLSLATSELVSNIVQHSEADAIVVRFDDRDPERWTIEVGGGRSLPTALADPRTWIIAAPGTPQGRGLGIVRAVVDGVEVVHDAHGLVIRCHRSRS